MTKQLEIEKDPSGSKRGAGRRSRPSAEPLESDPDISLLHPGGIESDLFYGAAASTRKGRDCVLKILDATKSVLLTNGYSGLTLRLVAERARMAHSNVQYYFPTKEKLTESFMLALSAAFQKDVRDLIETSPKDPIEKFRRYIRYNIDTNRIPAVTVIFFELRAISLRSDFVLDALTVMYKRYRDRMEGLLAEANPALPAQTVSLRAAIIISLIDGLMIFLGGKNALDLALASQLGAEAEREILRLALAPA